MFKLKNQIQNYAWGSKTSINELFGIENPTNEPQAEIWMGTHSAGGSRHEESDELLFDVIEKSKRANLGSYTTNRFGELPYLFKIVLNISFLLTGFSFMVAPVAANPIPQQADVYLKKIKGCIDAEISQETPVAFSSCYGYTAGLISGAIVLGEITQKSTFCLPPNLSDNDLYLSILKFSKKRPEVLKFSTSSLVISAMIHEFPCTGGIKK